MSAKLQFRITVAKGLGVWFAKQSFEDKCIPNQEIGNEEPCYWYNTNS